MSASLRTDWTVDGLLRWEETQPISYEFNGTRPVAIVAGTEEHALIQAGLIQAGLIKPLGNRLTGTPHRAVGSELKLGVADRVRYLDAMVLCTPRQPARTIVDDPFIVFEILSPSSARTDLFAKNAEYRANPAIQRYVVLEQARPAALALHRKDDRWLAEPSVGGEAVMSLPEIGVTAPLTDIYRDITPLDDDEPG